MSQLKDILVYSVNNNYSFSTDIINVQKHQAKNLICGVDADYATDYGSDITFDNSNGGEMSKAIVEVPTDTKATEIVNDHELAFGKSKGDNTIIGVASALAISTSQAKTKSNANSQAIASANIFVEATGIVNKDKIATRSGDDVIVGYAMAKASGTAKTFAEGISTSNNFSSSIANSESTVLINAAAAGIDNQGKIATGKGNDIVIGIADTSTMGSAEATALTQSITALVNEYDISAINEIETAIAESNADATAISQTITLGIINSGRILTGYGNDVIIGLATNNSAVNVQTIAEAESAANDIASATAEAESFAIAEGFAIGIVNFNRINTGRGNDIIIGIAENKATADSIAEAVANASALDSNSQTNSDTIADTASAIAVGIDNASGLLMTSQGDDQIIGIGTVGITGGEFSLGTGNNLIVGYGSTVGVEEARINLGQGDDLFQSAIVNVDPVTGGISFQDGQSGSIKNTNIFGVQGNDTFELGGFEETVSIDGGQDHDQIKLEGNLNDYQINLHLSDNQSLSIQNDESTLIVKNVEAFYFGDLIYSFDHFA